MSPTPTTLASAPPPPRFCRRCNYDLRATTTNRCPECGRPFDPANPRTTRPRPARRWLRHVRRAAACLLILLLLLAAVWGWFFWGWYSERQALISLKLDPDDPYVVTYAPIVTPWPKQHLGRAGFVLDRVWFVDLTGRSDLTDLAPLARLTHLEWLLASGRGVTDLTPLAQLTNLQHLRLPRTGVTDLAPLAQLTNLQELQLSVTSVTDLTPLARLTALQRLFLTVTGVTDLGPLTRLTNLQVLWLHGTRVSDLAPLRGLKLLRILTVPKESITEAQVEALRRDLPDCTIERL